MESETMLIYEAYHCKDQFGPRDPSVFLFRENVCDGENVAEQLGY